MTPTHHNVLIIGAGLSGIGAACHLRQNCPEKSFAILEARNAIGGTWDLFRYPGIRSDSDMFTLGYSFAPWEEAKAIADGPSIRSYVRDTARRFGVDQSIRFRHRVVRADWSSPDSRWTVEVELGDTGEATQMTCDFLYGCTGYYRYDEGFTPHFEGVERFRGTVVHPQRWPEDLDYTGKRVVVIGSGATAVTLVPSMAAAAGHVTMLQRSPSYVLSIPGRDPLATLLRRALPSRAVYPLVRWKNVLLAMLFFQASRRFPDFVKGLLRRGVERSLPAGYDINKHFKPRYDPWDQRPCLVPDGDLFRVLKSGQASMVTDGIETFTETGLRLTSGRELEADVIITATGLNLLVLGGMDVSVNGRPVDLPKTVTYKGMMFSGIPNLALALGYTNASWTLKCDLVSHYVCRLLGHMDEHRYRVCTPLAPGPDEPLLPFLDLKSGYILRSIEQLPKQGAHPPWRLYQNYIRDVRLMKRGPLEDEAISFSRGATTPDRELPLAA